MKVAINESTLSAIGEAIREKTGKSDLIAPGTMPTEIRGIVSGGGCELEELNVVSNGTYTADEGKGYSPVIVNVPQDGAPTAEDLTFSGNIAYLYRNGNWLWMIDKYGDLMSFNNISDASYSFGNIQDFVDLSKVTMTLNRANVSSMFYNSTKIVKYPNVSGTITRYLSGLFTYNVYLTTEEINKFLSNLTVYPSDVNIAVNAIVQQCYSVRDFTYFIDWLQDAIDSYTGTINNSIYNQSFYYCVALDEITNLYLPFQSNARTSNMFSNGFSNTYRLKNLLFRTDNGVPYVMSWKGQTIDLSTYVGYTGGNDQWITLYNSGITADKKVTDDTTYQALKNDADWFASDINYSRYNHDSAVATINSLPDTSAYLATNSGTNTIKFKGASGALTDGGAINTLTEAEIAVATAKGWTVTFV